MLKKAKELPMKAYWAVHGFIWDLKRDEAGIDGIVIAVMLVVVAVLVVIMFWGSLKDLIGNLWEKIAGAEDQIPEMGGDLGSIN